MALSYSQGIRDFVARHGTYQRALQGGKIEIRTGSAPATANAAVTGTLLCTVTQASGTHTTETFHKGVVYLGGTGGTVDSITVNGFEVLGSAVSFNGTLTQTMLDVATQINMYVPPGGVKLSATANAASVVLSMLPGSGTYGSGWACTIGTTTLTGTNGTIGSTAGTGRASSNGLEYGATTAGVIPNSGVWSGVNVATGVAGYFRILGSESDAGASSTTAIRIQGVCGIASGDYPMTTTTLTSGQTHTIDSFTLTLPAA